MAGLPRPEDQRAVLGAEADAVAEGVLETDAGARRLGT